MAFLQTMQILLFLLISGCSGCSAITGFSTINNDELLSSINQGTFATEYFQELISTSPEWLTWPNGKKTFFQWLEDLYVLIADETTTKLFQMNLNNLQTLEEIGVIASMENVSVTKVMTFEDYFWILQGNNHSSIVLLTKVRFTLNGLKIDDALAFQIPGKFVQLNLLGQTNEMALLVISDQLESTKIRLYELNVNGLFTYNFQEFEVVGNSNMNSVRHESSYIIAAWNSTDYKIARLDVSRNRTILIAEGQSNATVLLLEDDSDVIVVLSADTSHSVYKIIDNILVPTDQTMHWSSSSILQAIFLPNSDMVAILYEDHISLNTIVNGTMEELWKQDSICSAKEFSSLELEDAIVLIVKCSSLRSYVTKLKFLVPQSDSPFTDDDEEMEFLRTQLDDCRTHWNKQLNSSKQTIKEMEEIKKYHESMETLEGITLITSEFDPAENLRYLNIADKLDNLTQRLVKLESMASNYLSYAANQTVTASVQIGNIYADVAGIYHGLINKVNQIPMKTYTNDYLRLDIDQNVNTDLSFDVLTAVDANIGSLCDERITIQPIEMMRYNNPHQIVTGHHTYSSVIVSGGSIVAPPGSLGVLNDIKSNEFVLRSSHMYISEEKTFKSFVKIEELQMNQLNNVSYDAWMDNFRSFGKMRQYKQPLTILGDVEVTGNIQSPLINNIDVRKVYQNAVKPSNFVVSGPVEFEQELEVTENINIYNINGIPWTDVLSNGDEEVKANLHIHKAIVKGDLISKSINGLNFEREVYSKTKNQDLEGVKTFISDIVITGTDGLTMDDGALINNVDPSADIRFIRKENYLLIKKPIYNKTLEFHGNVQISALNGDNFPDFENTYWRKSVAQTIKVPIHAKNIEFRGNLSVNMLNGRKVDKYLTKNANQVLTGANVFLDNLTINDIHISEGHTIDGVDLVALDRTAITLDSFQSITQPGYFSDIEVNSLEASNGKINDISVHELFHEDNPVMEGKLVFKDDVTVGSFHGPSDWKISKINGHKMEDIDEHQSKHVDIIDGSLSLLELDAKRIKVEGLINGINFTEWSDNVVYKRNNKALTLNNTVLVKGKVTFQDGANFHIINGKLWHDYSKKIFRNNNNSHVYGLKKFARPIKILGDLIVENVQGVNFSNLTKRILLKNEPQNITAHFTFDSYVYTDFATIKQINDVVLDNIVLRDSPLYLKGKTSFANGASIRQFFAPHSWLGGCNLDQALDLPEFNSRFDLGENFSIGHIEVRGSVTTDHQFRNRKGESHFEVLKNLVKKTEPATILAPVSFGKSVFIKDLHALHINDVSLEDFLSVEENRKIMTHCDLNFTKPVNVNYIRAKNIKFASNMEINGVSLDIIKRHGVPEGSMKPVYGKKTFNGHLNVSNLNVTYINDILIEKLVQRDQACSNFPLDFSAIHIHKDFDDQTPGNRNSTANRVFSKIFSTDFLKNPKGVHMYVQGGIISSEVNQVKLTDLVKSNVPYQVIKGQKTLKHLTLFGDLKAKRINGIPMPKFFDNHTWYAKHLTSFNNYGINLYQDKLIQLKESLRYNKELAKGLHITFKSLNLTDYVKISQILWAEPTSNGYFDVVEDLTGYCEAPKCGCSYAMHSVKIRNGTSLAGVKSFHGTYILLDSPKTGNLYDFTLSCETTPAMTTVRSLRLDTKRIDGSHILEEEEIDLGIIIHVKHFVVERSIYFVAVTSGSENYYTISTYEYNNTKGFILLHNITISNRKIDLTQSFIQVNRRFPLRKVSCEVINLKSLIEDFDYYIQINGSWHLLAITSKENSINYDSEVLHFIWTNHNKTFDLLSAYPEEKVSSAIFASIGDKHFLILSHMCPSSYKNIPSCNVHVYMKTLDTNKFLPYQILDLHSASDVTSFVADDQLYLSISSIEQLKIYRLVTEEGFAEVGSMFVQLSSTIFVEGDGQYFLVGVHELHGIYLISMVFEGLEIKWYNQRIEKLLN